MGSFSVEELSIDAPSMGALKIRMKATGICHSDLFVIDGRLPLPLPCVIGHEGAGTNNAKIEPSSSVVILGCGGVGLFIIQGAKLAGANKIIAIDIADNKLKRAQHFGATHLINSERYAPVETVHEITGKAADYAFEAVGIPKLMEQADEAVPRGGTAIIVGIAALTDTVSYNAMVLVASTKAIKGCIYGDANPPVAFPRLIDLYKSGKLNLDDMVSRTYSIDEAPHAFEDMKNNANARGVQYSGDRRIFTGDRCFNGKGVVSSKLTRTVSTLVKSLMSQVLTKSTRLQRARSITSGIRKEPPIFTSLPQDMGPSRFTTRVFITTHNGLEVRTKGDLERVLLEAYIYTKQGPLIIELPPDSFDIPGLFDIFTRYFRSRSSLYLCRWNNPYYFGMYIFQTSAGGIDTRTQQ